MIIWKAIISTAHPYRVMWKTIVKTDKRNPRKERIRHWSWLLSKLSFLGKYTTFIIFAFKCTFCQMTHKYLTCLKCCLFHRYWVISVWCNQPSAFMWTNYSFARELHLELWWIVWAVNHKQKAYPPKRGSKIWFDSKELRDTGLAGGVTLGAANGSGWN